MNEEKFHRTAKAISEMRLACGASGLPAQVEAAVAAWCVDAAADLGLTPKPGDTRLVVDFDTSDIAGAIAKLDAARAQLVDWQDRSGVMFAVKSRLTPDESCKWPFVSPVVLAEVMSLIADDSTVPVATEVRQFEFDAEEGFFPVSTRGLLRIIKVSMVGRRAAVDCLVDTKSDKTKTLELFVGRGNPGAHLHFHKGVVRVSGQWFDAYAVNRKHRDALVPGGQATADATASA